MSPDFPAFLIAQIKSHDPPPRTVNHVRLNYSIIYAGTDPSQIDYRPPSCLPSLSRRASEAIVNRKDKERRVHKPDGKVFEVRDLDVQRRHLDPDYEFEMGDGTLGPTGHLIVFTLKPIRSGLPAFTARWDGGVREGGKERFDLDVDIDGVSESERRRFRNGKEGYAGHHAVKVQSATGHAYDVTINTPRGTIFEAAVSFTLHRKLGLDVSSSPVATLNIRRV